VVTLSIVSHRQGVLVATLLADIARIAADDRRWLERIVVTRNVDEPPITVPPALAGVTSFVDNAEPLGFGANHNQAFERCGSAFFAILNPDLRLPDDPFAKLLERLNAAEDIALVAPRIVAPDGRVEDAARQLITPWRLFRRRVLRRDRSAAADFDWLAGMFFVVRSSAFRAVGGFDARYFMYCEDFDLCARLSLAGWRFLLDDRVRVVHAAQRDSHRSVRHLTWHATSLVRMWLSSAFWRYRHALGRRR
jgi:N-acetylglucosaminyl-diphospho-decaprenol L-rhamnosyltransferase